jgi:hypothetical protein
MKYKNMSIILISVAFVTAAMAVSGSSDADAADTWDGTADYGWFNESPYASTSAYAISSAEQLAALAILVNTGVPAGSEGSSGLTNSTPVDFKEKTINLSKDLNISGND